MEQPPMAPTTEAIQTPTTAPTTAPAHDDIVAHVNGIAITRSQLDQPLIDAFGLKILLNLVQLDLAKQTAERNGLHVSPQDVRDEKELTFSKMFTDAPKSEYEQLFEQFLRQQNLSRVEFDLVLETNAYLRKIAEPQLAGKIQDADVRRAFSQLYGENRQIRDIELTNLREVAEAKQRLTTEPFEKVAREMSLDRRTAALGGELPPFSAQAMNVPKEIKDAAFSLQLNQVSDALQSGTAYHLIKLVSIIPPKIVKYEDVKDSVRKELDEQWVQYAMKELRNQLGQLALQTMQIDDPVLAAQWKEQLDRQQSKVRDRNEVLQDMNRRHETQATQPATSTDHPPATRPGAPAPGHPSTATTHP
jgi:parvulin-like peptidyl-prolyl isomerase